MIIVCTNKNIYGDFIHNSVNEFLSWLDAEYDPNFLDYKNLNSDYSIKKYGTIPKVILIMEICDNIEKVRALYPDLKIVTYTNDVHYFDEKSKTTKYLTYLNSDYLIAYYNKFKRFYGLTKSVYNTTHNCCSIFKRDNINENAIQKIFFYGKVNNNYSLRKDFIKNMKKCRARLVIKKHPGYKYKSSQKALKESHKTANDMYKYFCTFTCGLFPIFNIKEKEEDDYYLIGKFFEIMGNGSLLLCNDYKVKDQLESLGFYRGQHYIHIDNTNFTETIKYLFNPVNKGAILSIRKRAHSHTVENFYSAKVNRKLNSFLLALDRNEDVSHLVKESS
jgi:hypothetical protein